MIKLRNIVLEKKNNHTIIIIPTEEYKNELRIDRIHLCPECNNFYNCPKVKDKNKRTINQYTFITDGIQLINEEGITDNLIVKNCKCYEKEHSKNNEQDKYHKIHKVLTLKKV